MSSTPEPKRSGNLESRGWNKQVFDALDAWRLRERRAVERQRERRAAENEWIVNSAPHRAPESRTGGPAWACTRTRAEGRPLPAPGVHGCAGCGANSSTSWRATSTPRGSGWNLCARCAEDLDACGYTWGAAWRDRLACRAAGMRPGSGYRDFAAVIGFRAYAEAHPDGAGTEAPFEYLGDDLGRLRTEARLTWPESLIDDGLRARWVAFKAESERRAIATRPAPARPGALRLTPPIGRAR